MMFRPLTQRGLPGLGPETCALGDDDISAEPNTSTQEVTKCARLVVSRETPVL
jgi:hypothetical protein